MTELIVVGGASLDILHFAGRTERAAGGAGLYTALAADRAGARVTMIGPRPDPMPPELTEAAGRLEWKGRTVAPEELPTFEIAHLGDGVTELRNIWWRAEADLAVTDLPQDLPDGFVYCIALADPRLQVEFLRHLESLGRRLGTGTFTSAFRAHPEAVREAFALADVFFCNEREATEIFGSLAAARTTGGKLLFVTRGRRGVRVIQGEQTTDVPALLVPELDPTGAGDTFCGTTLTWLERGLHPVLSAERGVAAAAEMVTGIGPAKLLEPPRAVDRPPARAVLDHSRVDRVAQVLAVAPEAEPFDFVGPNLPSPGHPRALELFFASTLQQFGFWTDEGERYLEPVIAAFDGRELKGSDFLAACYRRWLERSPDGLSPRAQAGLTRDRLRERLVDDRGICPLPDLDERLELARSYGRDLIALGVEPAELVERANRERRPLEALLRSLDRIGGYKEDPLRKKSALLAIILRQRPEGFLRSEEDDDAPPIVDYHVQRSCLRMGLVLVTDRELAGRIERRKLLARADEDEIRRACYEAVDELRRRSRRPMGAVDWFLFQNRTRCPEMSAPDCENCPVDPACAHERELFQPVLRTTFY